MKLTKGEFNKNTLRKRRRRKKLSKQIPSSRRWINKVREIDTSSDESGDVYTMRGSRNIQ
ncbi:MAG: hypothetical protein ACTSSP_06100 [Candidatus Asgardarchaeia archaeon]